MQRVEAIGIETIPPEALFHSPDGTPQTKIDNVRPRQMIRVTVAVAALLTPSVYDTLVDGAVSYAETQNDPVAANGSICFDTDATEGEAIIETVVATQAQASGWINPRHPDAPTHANSALNFAAGDTIANTTVVNAPYDGETCITTSSTTHIVSDVTGYIAAGVLRPANPDGSASRLLDTRRIADITGGSKVPDNGDVCIDTDAQEGESVVATITVTQPKSAGWVNARHPDAPARANSTVNYAANQTVANTTVINPDQAGNICITTMSATHIVVDVAGYLAADAMRPANPDGSADRVLDTRLISGPTQGKKIEPLMVSPPPFGVCINTDAQAGETVVATITATQPEGNGWFNARKPEASPNSNSNLNYRTGQTIANTTFITPNTSGEICLTTHARSHAVIDIIGYLGTGVMRPAKADGSAERFVDTRIGRIGRYVLLPPGEYEPCTFSPNDKILSWYDYGPIVGVPDGIVNEYDLFFCNSGRWVYPIVVA